MDFKLKAPQGTPGARFCFAVADRKVLRLLRDSRWDLVSTLASILSFAEPFLTPLLP